MVCGEVGALARACQGRHASRFYARAPKGYNPFMQEQQELRVAGVVDHIAVKTEDMEGDVREYERLGFRVETLYEDWAMLRDAQGFGVALLPEGSKHPPHIAIRVRSRGELETAARREGRPIREHRDRSVSFYTNGVGGRAVEVIYYPPDYKKE